MHEPQYLRTDVLVSSPRRVQPPQGADQQDDLPARGDLDPEILCQQCEEPWCAAICPSGAISKGTDALSGATVVTVSEEKCVGCKMCMLACPYGNIVVRAEGHAEKCDLCGGDPQCVKFCPRGALKFVEVDDSIRERKQKLAATLLTAYKEAV